MFQVFFRTYYQPDSENFPEEADHVDRLAKSFVVGATLYIDYYYTLGQASELGIAAKYTW